jgi:hypothetical protein
MSWRCLGRLKERDHSEDLGVDGTMGSEWVLGRLTGGVLRIKLAQDRDPWWGLVNAAMNLHGLLPRS